MNIDIEHETTQPYPDHGPDLGCRCWPLPSDSDEALLSIAAVEAGAAGDATATGGPGHGVPHRAVHRPVRTVLPPSPVESVDDPARVPMPAFDERSAASLACPVPTGSRHGYGRPTDAGGGVADRPGEPAVA